MAKTHTVAAGDWIGALAKQYGFDHWSAIWDHPSNDALRLLRRTPDLLMVGDALQIPDAAPTEVVVRSGQRALFVLRRTSDVLRVRITGIAAFVELFGPIDYELAVGDESFRGALTDEGQTIEVPLPYAVTTAMLVLMGGQRYELTIGGLGPVSEGKGSYGRLQSLGFVAEVGPAQQGVSATSAKAIDPLSAALKRFQRRNGLAITGQLDADTQRALVAAYGS